MVRDLDLKKPPSIAESIDWARALLLLGAEDIDEEMLKSTMSIIVKHRTDLDLVAERVGVKLTDGLIGSRPGGRKPELYGGTRRAAGPARHGAAAAGVRRRAAQRGHGRGHLRAAGRLPRAGGRELDRPDRVPRGAGGHAGQVPGGPARAGAGVRPLLLPRRRARGRRAGRARGRRRTPPPTAATGSTSTSCARRSATRCSPTTRAEGQMRDLARLAIAAFGRQGEGSGVIGVDVQRIRRTLDLQGRAARAPSSPTPRPCRATGCASSSATSGASWSAR